MRVYHLPVGRPGTLVAAASLSSLFATPDGDPSRLTLLLKAGDFSSERTIDSHFQSKVVFTVGDGEASNLRPRFADSSVSASSTWPTPASSSSRPSAASAATHMEVEVDIDEPDTSHDEEFARQLQEDEEFARQLQEQVPHFLFPCLSRRCFLSIG